VACSNSYVREVYGYTVVDGKKAVETLSGLEYSQLFGATTERALIFTNIGIENSPMMIVRINNLKPRVVVFYGVKPDENSIRLAEYDRIPLIYSSLPSVEQLVKTLRKLYRIALRRKLGRPVRPPPKISA
jgi:putative transcriptional regulator